MSDRKSNCPSRPYHLWNAKTNKRLPSKFYSDPKRAHWAALKEMRWSPVGTTLEVLNVVRGQELGQYTRGVNAIRFTNGRELK